MTTVIDASVVAAALVDTGHHGRWAEGIVAAGELASPHLLFVETASVLRRAVAGGDISDDIATLAHRDLLDLTIHLYSYEALGPRVWELRHNVTPYDAWYVALAEALDAPLATMDQRLADAPGPRCTFSTPNT